MKEAACFSDQSDLSDGSDKSDPSESSDFSDPSNSSKHQLFNRKPRAFSECSGLKL